MIPDYIKKGRIARKIGLSDREFSVRLKNGFLGRDKKRIAEVFSEFIRDLQDRVSVLKGSEG